MLKRPSTRRKSEKKGVELNLVPILDTLVTLIAFVLFTMSFLNLVMVESPAPVISAQENAEKLKEKPLQLTLSISEKESEIWSPFEKIKASHISHDAEGKPDIKAIHEALLGIKQLFPLETKIVVVPYGGMPYDVLVAVMDTARIYEKTDPPLFVKNVATGNDEPAKLLFPEIIFGNLLGGG